MVDVELMLNADVHLIRYPLPLELKSTVNRL